MSDALLSALPPKGMLLPKECLGVPELLLHIVAAGIQWAEVLDLLDDPPCFIVMKQVQAHEIASVGIEGLLTSDGHQLLDGPVDIAL